MRTRMVPAALAVGLLFGCAKSEEKTTPASEPATVSAAPAPGSPEAKIAEAMTAAPKSIAEQATVMDWPATEGGQMTQLRAGTNGWTCFPSSPAAVTAADKDPMCLDGSWLAFAEAWSTHGTPKITHVGIGYMLQGDAGSSATDPFAMSASADNQWVESPPHLMIIVPDPRSLEGFSTDATSGRPYVMWPGTPYAHIMAPLADKM